MLGPKTQTKAEASVLFT